jgi:thymidine phosphorylase
VREVSASRGGYVASVRALGIGHAALALGAGREEKGDTIDPGSGVEILVKAGDRIEEGEPVARLYGERNVEHAEELVKEALELSDEPFERPPAILDGL